ncbi:MAG: nucleotidyltransferase family protein [Bacteroidetes bacterium]|nr:nucleotidyltransferase family protein [Bacteroidota bacterium]
MFYSAKHPEFVNLLIETISNQMWKSGDNNFLNELSEEKMLSYFEYLDANGILFLTIDYLNDSQSFNDLPLDVRTFCNNKIKINNELDNYHKKITVEIVNNFKSQNINYLILKGQIFTYILYPKQNVRPCRDLDIIVKKSHIEKALKILRNMGFFSINSHEEAEQHLPRMIRKENNNFRFSVEIHHRLVPKIIYGIKVNEFNDYFNRKQSYKINQNTDFYSLCYEDHIVHMHLHLFHHIFYNFRFIHLADILFSINNWQDHVNWSQIGEKIDNLGLAEFRNFLWNFINHHFKTHLPTTLYRRYDFEKISTSLLEHGSIPIFSSFNFKNSNSKLSVIIYEEIKRYFYRSLKAPSWNFFK